MGVDLLKRREMMFKYPGASGSPYSVDATLILMNAFPNDWEAMRQYGFDHPECVADVNYIVTTTYYEEDKHIIYTFIPVKIRFLRNTAGAYINTGYYPSSDTGFDVEFRIREFGTRQVLGSREGWMNQALVLGVYTGNFSTGAFYFGTHAYDAQSKVLDTWQTHKLRNKVYTNRTGVTTELPDTFATTTRSMALFCGNLRDQGGFTEFGVLDMTKCYIYEGDTLMKQYIPFIRSNTPGMIDLLDGTFKGKEGSGTFEIIEESNV